jgi:hypothetical protein
LVIRSFKGLTKVVLTFFPTVFTIKRLLSLRGTACTPSGKGFFKKELEDGDKTGNSDVKRGLQDHQWHFK